MYDVMVIGGGPAGMTAALYAARAGKSVCILEREGFGGQIARSPRVENIPGNISSSGAEFADKMMDQIMAFGVELEVGAAVRVERAEDGTITVGTDLEDEFQARTLVIAAGATRRKLRCPGAEELEGRGVYYCVTCDGDFAKGKETVMLGGGNSAVVESLVLTDLVPKLTVLYAEEGMFPLAEDVTRRAILARDNVEVFPASTVVGLESEGGVLSGVVVDGFDLKSGTYAGQPRTLPAGALFVSIGLVPDNGVFADLVDLDARGYIVAGEDCATKTPNIWAAGDCRTKRIRQVTTACADGTVAAIAACAYCDMVD